VILAEEIATLDIVTEGRLEFGLGLGYRAEEFDYIGIPYKERAPRLDETIELLMQLWTEPEVTHKGRFFELDHVRPHIQPLQKPYPPLWVGGHSDRGARRAGRYGDFYPCPPRRPSSRWQSASPSCAPSSSSATSPSARSPLVATCSWRPIGKSTPGVHEGGEGALHRLRPAGPRRVHRDQLEDDFIKTTGSHAILGSPEEVTASLRGLIERLPIDPVIFKPQWPSMSADEAIEAIKLLGRTVIAELKDHPPLPICSQPELRISGNCCEGMDASN